MPAGADAVVPVEDTDVPPGVADLPTSVAIRASTTPGRHIRTTGSDLRAGSVVLEAGADAHAGALVAALAATGHASVLRPSAAAGRDPRHGRRAGAARRGARPGHRSRTATARRSRPRRRTWRRRRSARASPRTTSTTSGRGSARACAAGRHRHRQRRRLGRRARRRQGGVRRARRSCDSGASPSSPASRSPSGARTASDGRTCLLFGLPGNPVSSFVTFELFVRPVLRRSPATPRIRTDACGVRAELADASPARPGAELPARPTSIRPTPTAGAIVHGRPEGRIRTCCPRSPRPTAWRSSPRRSTSFPQEPRWRSSGLTSNAGKPRGRGGPPRARSAPAGDQRRGPGPGGPQGEPPAGRAERRRLTHVDRMGRPRMVDVSDKPATARRAVAEALVVWTRRPSRSIIDGHATKGDVLTVAEMAGVMGAKRTAELIPLCHPIALTDSASRSRPTARRAACASRARRDDRADRRRDGGADRGIDRRADRLRHGQVRRPRASASRA